MIRVGRDIGDRWLCEVDGQLYVFAKFESAADMALEAERGESLRGYSSASGYKIERSVPYDVGPWIAEDGRFGIVVPVDDKFQSVEWDSYEQFTSGAAARPSFLVPSIVMLFMGRSESWIRGHEWPAPPERKPDAAGWWWCQASTQVVRVAAFQNTGRLYSRRASGRNYRKDVTELPGDWEQVWIATKDCDGTLSLLDDASTND